LTKVYRIDDIPAIDSMRTTVCWRPPWTLRHYRIKPTAHSLLANPALDTHLTQA